VKINIEMISFLTIFAINCLLVDIKCMNEGKKYEFQKKISIMTSKKSFIEDVFQNNENGNFKINTYYQEELTKVRNSIYNSTFANSPKNLPFEDSLKEKQITPSQYSFFSNDQIKEGSFIDFIKFSNSSSEDNSPQISIEDHFENNSASCSFINQTIQQKNNENNINDLSIVNIIKSLQNNNNSNSDLDSIRNEHKYINNSKL